MTDRSFFEFEEHRKKVDQRALTQLVRDLYSPPQDFPEFDMNYHYFIDEGGNEYGDIAAFLAARSLGGGKYLQGYSADGGDVVLEAMNYAGLSANMMAMLVMPQPLIAVDYPLHTITQQEAAELVTSFAESGYVTPNYLPIIESIFDLTEDDDLFQDTYSEEGITRRVDGFLNRYGTRE